MKKYLSRIKDILKNINYIKFPKPCTDESPNLRPCLNPSCKNMTRHHSQYCSLTCCLKSDNSSNP